MSEPRARIVHFLKCWPHWFQLTLNAHKRFEIRKNDRDFRVGDHLILQEWDPNGLGEPDEHGICPPERGKYTGRSLEARVDYVLKAFVLGTELPLDPEYCVMSISRLP